MYELCEWFYSKQSWNGQRKPVYFSAVKFALQTMLSYSRRSWKHERKKSEEMRYGDENSVIDWH